MYLFSPELAFAAILRSVKRGMLSFDAAPDFYRLKSEAMGAKQPVHFSFLVRLWLEEGTKKWRAIVINIYTGERRGFADMGRLLSFLEEKSRRVMKTSPGRRREEDGKPR